MMLCDYYPERQNLSWIEITVAVWFATLLIEELRQVGWPMMTISHPNSFQKCSYTMPVLYESEGNATQEIPASCYLLLLVFVIPEWVFTVRVLSFWNFCLIIVALTERLLHHHNLTECNVFLQFYLIETNRVWLKTTIYFNDVWNLVDIGAVIMFVIGFTLRVVDHTSVVTKVRTTHSLTR